MLKAAYRSDIYTKIFTFATLVAAFHLNASPAYAVNLPAGTAAFATAEAKPDGASNLLLTTGAVFFAAPGYSGTLTSNVFDGDATNPNGPTALTFTYLITNAPSSTHELHRFTVSSFQSFATDVSYSSLSVGREPTFIDRNPLGDVVGFTFPTPILPFLPTFGALEPGLTSRLLVIQTDATRFTLTTASVINGSTTSVLSLAPDKLVPEPSTLALGALGLIGTLAIAIRKRRRARVA